MSRPSTMHGLVSLLRANGFEPCWSGSLREGVAIYCLDEHRAVVVTPTHTESMTFSEAWEWVKKRFDIHEAGEVRAPQSLAAKQAREM